MTTMIQLKFLIILISMYFIQCGTDLSSPHVQRKLQQKLKQEMHAKQKSFKPSSCDNITGWLPKENRELFVISNQNTLSSIKSIKPDLDNCTDKVEMIEIIWRYKFFESMHCIRVELDFGESLTNFIQNTNYKYYSFSYRELGKKNNYLTRQALNESVNTLTIRRANLRPYIICVNFYKKEFIYTQPFNYTVNNSNDTTNNATETVPDLTCPEYEELLKQDDFTHNIDLCVDIDTQEHFLSTVSHDGNKSEFLMVVFITILLIILLVFITVANYIIQKPKKRLLLHNLRKYIMHKRHNQHNHQNDQHNEDYTALTRSSSFGTKISSSKPQIVVTDFSSNGSIDQPNYFYHHYNQKVGNYTTDESKESDTLLIKSTEKLAGYDKQQHLQSILKSSHDEHNSGHHLVTFDVGETIKEEENEDSVEYTNTNETVLSEEEKPSVISMSHILDDKPWLIGRSNSIITTNTNNGSRATFETEAQLNKRLNSFSINNNNNNNNNNVELNSGLSIVNETNKAK